MIDIPVSFMNTSLSVKWPHQTRTQLHDDGVLVNWCIVMHFSKQSPVDLLIGRDVCVEKSGRGGSVGNVSSGGSVNSGGASVRSGGKVAAME